MCLCSKNSSPGSRFSTQTSLRNHWRPRQNHQTHGQRGPEVLLGRSESTPAVFVLFGVTDLLEHQMEGLNPLPRRGTDTKLLHNCRGFKGPTESHPGPPG